MRVFRDYQAQPRPTGAVALGAFDGLHLGHQALLRTACRLAAEACGEVAAVTAAGDSGRAPVPGAGHASVVCFEPLPRQYFARGPAVARLSTAAERLRLLQQMGIQQTWQLRFNAALVATSAEDFVQRVIVSGLRARHVVVGSDFRFGAQRRGDVALLRELGRAAGFAVQVIEPVLYRGEAIRSSRIRTALAAGDLPAAEAMLGRPFSMRGRVRRGRQLGRDLGYPTANLALPRRVSPLEGIFAVRVRIDNAPDSALLNGVASLGRRPTVVAGEPLLEVHLFDFDGDLYHRHLEVIFVQKLRDEAHFPTIAAMVAQIHDDAAQARRILEQG